VVEVVPNNFKTCLWINRDSTLSVPIHLSKHEFKLPTLSKPLYTRLLSNFLHAPSITWSLSILLLPSILVLLSRQTVRAPSTSSLQPDYRLKAIQSCSKWGRGSHSRLTLWSYGNNCVPCGRSLEFFSNDSCRWESLVISNYCSLASTFIHVLFSKLIYLFQNSEYFSLTFRTLYW